MSQRRALGGNPDEQIDRMLRDMKDQIEKLEKGAVLLGQVSVASIIIGGITVTVTDAGGDHRDVTFRNPLNGATSTIHL